MSVLPVSFLRVQRTAAGDDFHLVPGVSGFTMSPGEILNSALVLIDVWPAAVQNWARAEAITTQIIAPCVNASRAKGMKIVHAPSGLPCHPAVWSPGDAVVATSDVIEHYTVLNNLLTSWGVNRVFFCGHAKNMCLLGRPTAPAFMILANKMRSHVLIGDASAPIEVAGSVGTPLGDAAEAMVSYFGDRSYVCRSADYLAAMS